MLAGWAEPPNAVRFPRKKPAAVAFHAAEVGSKKARPDPPPPTATTESFVPVLTSPRARMWPPTLGTVPSAVQDVPVVLYCHRAAPARPATRPSVVAEKVAGGVEPAVELDERGHVAGEAAVRGDGDRSTAVLEHVRGRRAVVLVREEIGRVHV